MKILLVGATGTLGRQIAKQAIEDGHEVRCFVRNPRKASFLQEWGCELTKGNLLNSSDIEYALQDIEVVIDAATSKPDDPKSIYEIDWDGKLNLYNACESLDADMSKTYEILELKKEDMTSLESYIKEYYQQILKRLREMEADLNIEEKKRLPF